jgi:hypothetical protein
MVLNRPLWALFQSSPDCLDVFQCMSDYSFDGALFIVKGLEVLNLELISWGYSSLFEIADL